MIIKLIAFIVIVLAISQTGIGWLISAAIGGVTGYIVGLPIGIATAGVAMAGSWPCAGIGAVIGVLLGAILF